MKKITFYKKPESIKKFSKEMRDNETPAEYALRRKLKSNQLNGHKFHRQKSIFVDREDFNTDHFIIADFYNHPAKLIIEIDGNIHNKEKIKKRDKYRELSIKKAGYNLIRFTNDEVMTAMNEVLEEILNKIKGILSK